jgi:hypothetical protein
MTPTDKCQSCKFWIPAEDLLADGTRNGLCRRYPPSVQAFVSKDVAGQFTTHSFFPPMSENGWCGEFAIKVILQ